MKVLVGGYSDAAIRRAARLGDGWLGVNPTLEELGSLSDRLLEARRAAGTDGQPFEIRTGVKGRLEPGAIGAMGKLGVDGLVVTPWQLVEKGVELTAESVMDGLPDLVDTIQGAL
jgi:hypothetical protein